MKYKSSLLAQASGSVGGSTYSRNRYGAYIRNRAVPVNPGTQQQEAVRGFFSQLTSLWANTLTDTQREAWDTYGANVPLTDKLGDPIFCNGFCHYVRSNVPRLQAGLPRVDDGPETFNLGDFTPITYGATGAGNLLAIGFTEADDWVGEDDASLLIYSSRNIAPTINYFRGPYRFGIQIDGDATTPPTTPVAAAGPFDITVGNKSFGYAVVTRADGRLSAKQFVEAVVA